MTKFLDDGPGAGDTRGNGVVATPLVVLSQAGPALWLLFRIWLQLGVQSFGGGMATLYMIRRAVVDQRQWLTAAEFTQDWALCQAAPGINLICMTILIGRRVAGIPGALVAVIGLLLPSVSITITMTALYATFRDSTLLQSALHGVVPATVGLGLLLSSSMARPLLAASWRESWGSLVVSSGLLVGSALALLLWHLPVILVLCCAGLIGALTAWQQTLRKAYVRHD
ncbi:MAG TPA: chromate transporter [Caldilineaceae bacterium]|nr:chromate transporter [Caldilineaceae bacterium]